MAQSSPILKLTVDLCLKICDNSLYDKEIASFDMDDSYDQNDAEGFIKLNALRLRLGKRLKD